MAFIKNEKTALEKKKKHLHPNKREEPPLLFKCLADFIKFEIRFGKKCELNFSVRHYET